MFTEHIRNSLSRSLWAELLDDRKFYFPISSKDPQAAVPPSGGGGRDASLHKWRPVGPDEKVVMDKSQPFVGDQSPRIELDASVPHGIRQGGFALVKDKKYTGRIVLRGTPSTHVKVELVWGEGEGGRQTIIINSLRADYQTIPLSFTAQADTSDATFEIAGTGAGDFHVGAVSLMPADNLRGFRPDAISVLRQINMGFWRYGGNYTSGLIWYHIVGDPDKRPPDFDYAWGAMQPNDLGLDEFMTLCKLINVDPYISVNAGFGDSHSAAEEVEYMNGSASTYMGAKRARNGHPEPYHVKFWNIGNEPWGSWQLGRTDTKYFMLKHNEFAKAMRAVDPSIILIASGRFLQDDTLRGDLRAKYAGNIQPLYGTEADWTGSFLAQSWGNFDGIAEHWYAQGGHHFDVEVAKKLAPDASNDGGYVKVDQTLQEWARYPADIVHMKAEEWQGYQQRFPAMVSNKIFLSIDEYAYSIGGGRRAANLKLALAYGMIFNEMLRHTDFLTMAAHTTGSAMMDFTPTAATLNTTGLVFKLYGDHFVDTIPVAVSGNSPQPAPKYPPGADQPKTSSGSPTYPLDIVATLTPDHKYLTLAVVNATESEQKFGVNITGTRVAGTAKLWQMTANSLDAANRVGETPQVEVKETSLGTSSETITVAPISVNVYQLPVAQSAP
jgi:alpha-N-arabinofuranosidase